jgi:hypothetical protein
VHSVGIIVREMKGGKQVLFFDQDYERKLFVVGSNTLDYVPVNYEKLFDAYTKIEVYMLSGKKLWRKGDKTDIDVKMAAVLDPSPENVKKVHTLKAKKTHKKRISSSLKRIKK